MKQFIKKHALIISTLALLFVLGIPVLINCLFKLHPSIDFFSAEWDAGDALGFYGTLLGAVATVGGVFLSIQYAQKNYREDERNRQLPFFALTYMRPNSNYSPFQSLPTEQESKTEISNDEIRYSEERLNSFYIVLSTKGISYLKQLSEKQQKILLQDGYDWEPQDQNSRNYKLIRNQYVSIPFEAENVGNGAALDLMVAFNLKNSSEQHGVSVYTVKTNDVIYFHIFSEMERNELFGEYILELRYRDILGNSYSQKYPISIIKENNRIQEIVNFSGIQEPLNKETNNRGNS